MKNKSNVMKDLQEHIREKAKAYSGSVMEDEYNPLRKYTSDDLIEEMECAFEQGANFVLSKWQEAERWIPVNERLPHFDDWLVLVKVRNKNKENGIFLYDICYIDEETNTWGKRHHTWEDIIEWKPIK